MGKIKQVMGKQEKEKLEQRKKGVKPSLFRQQSRGHQSTNFKKGTTQQSLPAQSVNKPSQNKSKGVSEPTKGNV